MLYIIIPTYNEKENIEDLIHDICSQDLGNFKILIVDDNSPDGTAKVVESLLNKYPVEIIKRSGKLGLGTAYIEGFKYALSKGADMLIEMDADFSHNPNKISSLVNGVKNGVDMCLGSRRIKSGKTIGWGFHRKIMSRGAQDFSRLILRLKTKDVTSGFRCYHKRVFNLINLDKIKSNGYSFQEEMVYLLEKNNFKIKEVPIIFVDRQRGYSKLGFYEIYKFFINIFKLKFGRD